ncbi:MAG: hypothetical protein PUB51_07595, partial [Oscillospiraceae bacterium]|nr:hypothetical protein [Oscillospiraceae bacterium]
LVVVGWVLFNLTDFGRLLHALKMMFVWQPTNWFDAVAVNSGILDAVLWLPLGLVCMLPIAKKVRLPDNALGVAVSHVLHLGLAVLCLIFIISSSYNPFIYFRF